ncbi:hypothetical protein [Nostoc sp.]|uniref:hypothetical protein n=1 Tax=Nostoc sp. TaxID=1180 RepID=UPI002FFD0135
MGTEIQRKQVVRKYKKALEQRENPSKHNYLAQRLADIDEINTEIADWIYELQNILEHTLRTENTISVDDLRIKEIFPAMKAPQELLVSSQIPQFHKPPSLFKWVIQLLLFLEKAYIRAVKKAESNYQLAKKQYEEAETSRQVSLEHSKANYNSNKHTFILEIKKCNSEVDELETGYKNGQQAAIVIYNKMILERSAYPSLEGFQCLSYTDKDQIAFPKKFQVSYLSEAKQLMIDYELPNAKIIPTIAGLKYDHSKDKIMGTTRKPIEIGELYQDIVAAITLRTIREVFIADMAQHLNIVVFNGFVQKVDPVTRKDTQTYLISVQVTKDSFNSLNFDTIDKLTCLRNLGASTFDGNT